MRQIFLLLPVFLLCIFSYSAQGVSCFPPENGTKDTYYVPDDYPTIQYALNNAPDTSIIIVKPGTYKEKLLFTGGTSLTVKSEQGPDVTWIDGCQSGSTITLQQGIGMGSVIDGFSILNGNATNGGGIYCASSMYTIKNTKIWGNTTTGNGGGIYLSNSSPNIFNLLVVGNHAINGGGIYCHYSSPNIDFTTISKNTAADGGALYARNSYPVITHSILWSNHPNQIKQNINSTTVNYSDIQGGWSGPGSFNIDEDPLFSDPQTLQFHLKQDPIQPGIDNHCVDRGSDLAQFFGMDIFWTRTDEVHDTGMVDLGYHYNYSVQSGGSLLHVPSTSYPSINYAITKASAGDTIVVAPGTYKENIIFATKPITVKSSDGASVTVIDGKQIGSVIFIANNESYCCLLKGFTIKNGEAANGGGCYIKNASPRIKNCIIGGNKANDLGGGIYSGGNDTFPYLINNTISGNSAASHGGGLYCSNSNAQLWNNLFVGNWAAKGGGIYCHYSSPKIDFITISKNTAAEGGALYARNSYPVITHSILWSNHPNQIQQNINSTTVNYSDIQGGWTGLGGQKNMDADPEFSSTSTYDYYLMQTPCQPNFASPCVDWGVIDASVVEMDTLWTRSDGVPDSGMVDIGYHYDSDDKPLGITHLVPDDFNTIQEAINSASFGDTVLVSPGTYKENLTLQGKTIAVMSNQGPNVTILDGKGIGSVITCTSRETHYTVIEGFTIRNGCATNGGGVYIKNASPTLKGNIIDANTANDLGGGIYSGGTDTFPYMINNTIAKNSAASHGGGLYCSNSDAQLWNNLFVGNWAAKGGGIYCHYSSPKIDFITISKNTAAEGGALYARNSYPVITHSILWVNHPNQIQQNINSTTVNYSDIQGGWTGLGGIGIIDSDPLFRTGPDGHYYLSQIAAGQTFDSPCKDYGNTKPEFLRIDDYWTRTDEVADGGLYADLGFHYGPFSDWWGDTLSTDVDEIPLQGGQVNFTMKAGFENAGRNYILLGNATGTTPGTPLPGGYATLPLNFDVITDLIFSLLNTVVCENFMGILDSNGDATATLNLPTLTSGSGSILNFAFALNNPWDFASNPVSVEIVE